MSLYDPDATYEITVEGRPGRWNDGLLCPVCWGSHGCDLPPGHGGAHSCMVEPDELEDEPGGPCSEFDGSRARFSEGDGWSEWRDGWTAIPGTDR